MRDPNTTICIAFAGQRALATGSLADVARSVKALMDGDFSAPVLIFDSDSSAVIDLDLRGSIHDVLQRLTEPAPYPASPRSRSASLAAPADAALALAPAPDAPPRSGPGRPRLGVVAREVTLLPRHWQWLSEQPGGASVVLRKLVESARTQQSPKDRTRKAQESTYRFLSALGGDLPGFEEATRRLFAGDRAGFAEQLQDWPEDIRAHAGKLADRAFDTVGAAG